MLYNTYRDFENAYLEYYYANNLKDSLKMLEDAEQLLEKQGKFIRL